MRPSKTFQSLILVLLLLSGCAKSNIAPTPHLDTPTELPKKNLDVGEERSLLTYADLMDGFEAASPVDESALTPPPGAAPAQHTFEGRLELFVEGVNVQMEMLRGELEPEYRSLPAFEIEFVQVDGYLVPVQRGSVVPEHPAWNYIIEPGRVWQEAGDQGFSRTSFPFTLVVKGGNATFNGTMTFLFDDQQVSQVWYQVTQETTSYIRVNMWGLLEAAYHAESLETASRCEQRSKQSWQTVS